MKHDLILANVAKYITLTSLEVSYFTSLLKFRGVAKNECLLEAGEACNVINYVHTGVLRAYYLDKQGKESTIMFATADWWVTDMYCFLNQKPAMMHIEAVERSCIFQLTKNYLDQLFVEVPKFERFFRILMQNAYTREQLRTIQNLSLSAEARYTNFLANYPQVAQQVTQKQIASYLGITPEFLSTIRKNKQRGSIS